MVSWKEAAEKNERVWRLALVMPSRIGTATAGFLPSSTSRSFIASKSIWSICSPGNMRAVASVRELNLLQHLANDHLDVLVVDGHALEPVDVLDLVDEVRSKRLDALDRQNVVRRGIALDDVVALLDGIAFLKMERLALRDQVFDRLAPSSVGIDDDAALVLVVAPEADRAARFRR